MIDILCLLLKPSLYFLSDRRRYWYLLWAPVLAYPVDVAINHLTISIIAGDGWPRRGEWTFSQRLYRLCGDRRHPDQKLFIEIARKLNRLDPLHSHIPGVPPAGP